VAPRLDHAVAIGGPHLARAEGSGARQARSHNVNYGTFLGFLCNIKGLGENGE
jgi:hypothetical protein